MDRKYTGAQRMAGLGFGEREKALIAEVGPDSHGALALYEDLVKAGFRRSGEEMIKRFRKRFPENKICPEGPPHLLGLRADWRWRGYERDTDCKPCGEHHLEQLRAEAKTNGRRPRVLPQDRRVQQSQHRPGARSEERMADRRRANEDQPFVKNHKGEWVLCRSWRHLAGKLTPPSEFFKLLEPERLEVWKREDAIVKAEIALRRAEKAA